MPAGDSEPPNWSDVQAVGKKERRSSMLSAYGVKCAANYNDQVDLFELVVAKKSAGRSGGTEVLQTRDLCPAN